MVGYYKMDKETKGVSLASPACLPAGWVIERERLRATASERERARARARAREREYVSERVTSLPPASADG